MKTVDHNAHMVYTTTMRTHNPMWTNQGHRRGIIRHWSKVLTNSVGTGPPFVGFSAFDYTMTWYSRTYILLYSMLLLVAVSVATYLEASCGLLTVEAMLPMLVFGLMAVQPLPDVVAITQYHLEVHARRKILGCPLKAKASIWCDILEEPHYLPAPILSKHSWRAS